jgi:hypothetical protein
MHTGVYVGPVSPPHGASSDYRWRVAANMLNKQSWTADKGSPADWVLGGVLLTVKKI